MGISLSMRDNKKEYNTKHREKLKNCIIFALFKCFLFVAI